MFSEESRCWRVLSCSRVFRPILSYQKHFKRSEHWFIIEGKAKITLDGKEIFLSWGESVNIPLEAAHRIENRGDTQLTFIEIQRGDYFGEDDIVRLEDDYGRN